MISFKCVIYWASIVLSKMFLFDILMLSKVSLRLTLLSVCVPTSTYSAYFLALVLSVKFFTAVVANARFPRMLFLKSNLL